MSIMRSIKTGMAIVGKPRPYVIYHKPTMKCDCRCIFCDFWKKQPSYDDVLPAGKIITLLEKGRKAGMNTYTLWGGEPLMVEELPEFVAHAKKIGFRTILCSSCNNLEERYKGIAPFTDLLLASIEGVEGEHDRIRGVRGLFNRVMRGIEKFKQESKGNITIWCNVGKFNMRNLAEIAEVANFYDINIEFFPTSLYKGYNDRFILSPLERKRVFSEIIDLKRKGMPVSNTFYALNLMKSGRKYRCNMTRISVQVDPQGRVYPCEPGLVSDEICYGNIEDVNFKRLPFSQLYNNAVKKLSYCNKCLLPCVSHNADNLISQGIRRLLNNIRY